MLSDGTSPQTGRRRWVLYGFNPIHVLRNHVRASYVRSVAAGRTPLYDVDGGRLVAGGWAGDNDAIDAAAPGLLEAEWERTELFVREMACVASESGARFAVVLLDGPDRLSGWSESSRRLRTALEADIEVVDLEEAPDVVSAAQRYLHDDHPNASWHAATAEAIARAIAPPARGLKDSGQYRRADGDL